MKPFVTVIYMYYSVKITFNIYMYMHRFNSNHA